jgi:hypothetical protein
VLNLTDDCSTIFAEYLVLKHFIVVMVAHGSYHEALDISVVEVYMLIMSIS